MRNADTVFAGVALKQHRYVKLRGSILTVIAGCRLFLLNIVQPVTGLMFTKLAFTPRALRS